MSNASFHWKFVDLTLLFYRCLYSPEPSSDIKSVRRGEWAESWARDVRAAWVRPSPVTRPAQQPRVARGEARDCCKHHTPGHTDSVSAQPDLGADTWPGARGPDSVLAEADPRPWDFPWLGIWVMTLCRVTPILVLSTCCQCLMTMMGWQQWPWSECPVSMWVIRRTVSVTPCQAASHLNDPAVKWEMLWYECCEFWPLSDPCCSDADAQIRLWGVHWMSQSQYWQPSDSEIMSRLDSIIQTFHVYIKRPVLEKFHRSAEIVYQILIATFYVAS